MRVVIQRVLRASVEIENNEVASIENGLLLYICLEEGDTIALLEKAALKISKLRIFADDKDLMNLSIDQVNGEILSISQFTLSWQGEKGHRPSFDKSMEPKQARLYYARFNQFLVDTGCKVSQGSFGADMKVTSINDGPVTFSFSI